MKIAIMQPYFLPYIGYFQLISSVDCFVIYDNIKYTKKGWINRNRMLSNGKDVYFSIPLKQDSDYLHVNQRRLSVSFDKNKMLNQFVSAYRKSPYFLQNLHLLEDIILYSNDNLFEYIYHSIIKMLNHLNMKTKIVISSEIDIDHQLKNQEKVIALCKALNASAYINPIGGVDIYSKDKFNKNNINLFFLKSNNFEYPQIDKSFIPWLSIIDVLMFNSIDEIKEMINTNYQLM